MMTDMMSQPTEESSEPTPDAKAPESAPSTTEGIDSESTPGNISTIPDLEEPKGMAKKIKDMADDYVIPISDNAITQWAEAIKDKDINLFKNYVVQIACGLYPTLATQIAAGIPTRVLLDPYVRTAENILGPVMSEPDWTNSKWSAALQGGTEPKTGRPVPMTLGEWSQYLRQEPGHGWDKSPEAQDRASTFNQTLDHAFGATEAPQ